MSSNNIQLWVEQARQAGLSDTEIYAQMKQNGWSDEQIDRVLQSQDTIVLPPTSQTTIKVTKGKNKKISIIIFIIVFLIALAIFYIAFVQKTEVFGPNFLCGRKVSMIHTSGTFNIEGYEKCLDKTNGNIYYKVTEPYNCPSSGKNFDGGICGDYIYYNSIGIRAGNANKERLICDPVYWCSPEARGEQNDNQ